MVEIKTGPRSSDAANTQSSSSHPQPILSGIVESHTDALNQLTINSSLGITEAALDAIMSTQPQPDALTARGLELSLPPGGIYRIGQCEMKVEIFHKESDPVTAV